jgi:hypothetical protein
MKVEKKLLIKPFARSKPAVAAGITCITCLPAAGTASSPGLCFACGILIAKVMG